MAKQQEVLFNKALAKVLREVIAKEEGGNTGWELEAEQSVPLKWKLDENGNKIPSKGEIEVRPDILFKPAGGEGLAFKLAGGEGLESMLAAGESREAIIETEFDPAREVEEDAQKRLKEGLELYPGTVTRVERVFALCIDESFKDKSESALESELRQGNKKFSICFFGGRIGIKRHPSSGWGKVPLKGLANMIMQPTILKIEAEMFVLFS